MNMLLRSGASINASEGKNGRTVLHMAADRGNMIMLQFLLERRETNIDAFTYAGLTPIYLAFGRHHGEAVRLLLNYGASHEMQVSSDDSDMDNSDEELVSIEYMCISIRRMHFTIQLMIVANNYCNMQY